MRFIPFTLALIGAATFSVVTKGGDKNRSAELQVLDRFIGTWDYKVTTKVPGEEAKTHETVETRNWSKGGGFVLFENTAPPEFHMALTYNASNKEYTGVLISGMNTGLLTGTWDEQNQTMTFKGTLSDGNNLLSKHRFIDKDQAEHSGVIRSADGKVLAELLQKQTRRPK